MRRIIRSVLVGAIVVCATASTRAEVKLNSLFTDNMVLQRDIPAKVFGTADDGESVIVSINGQTAKTTAKGGEWLVALKPMKAGGPYRLTIEGKNTLILQNVVFGDVWLCTGQSNMDFDCAWFASPEKRQDEYLDEYKVYTKKYLEITRNAASYKNLRMFVAEKRPGAKRAGLEAVKDFDQSWQVSSEKYTLLTSAMGYVFGLRLHQHLNIPIGLIDTNKSGSPIETWMSAEALKAAGLETEADSHYNGNIFPVQKFAIKGVIWYQGESNAMSVESSIAYGRTFPTMIESWRKEWGQGDFPFLYVQHEEEKISLAGDWLFKRGLPAHKMPTAPMRMGIKSRENLATGLYNGMIAPVAPFAISGAIWYQGESNGGEGSAYTHKMRALIEGWRAAWGQGAFPFYFVQLANFEDAGDHPEGGEGWARIRMAQLKALDIENTGMAVAIDLADTNNPRDVHPENKKDVGERLALWALANDYGKKITYSGPLYKSMTIKGGEATISFDHIGEGLMVGGEKTGIEPVKSVQDGTLKRFAISGEDRKWHWADARIEGETVVVSSPEVAKPVAVRYAYTRNPDGCNLYNKAGLPASPFTTDKHWHLPALIKNNLGNSVRR